VCLELQEELRLLEVWVRLELEEVVALAANTLEAPRRLAQGEITTMEREVEVVTMEAHPEAMSMAIGVEEQVVVATLVAA